MIKNTINTGIMLICFSVFAHAYVHIPKEIDTDIDNSQNKFEENVIANLKSENTIWADTAEVVQKKKAKKKTYKAWVTLINQNDKVKGYLYAVNDSSIVVSSSSELLADEYSASLNNTIAVANIKKIRLRKKGNVGKGYIIGTSIGIVTGIILGATASEGDGFSTLAAAGMMGIVGSVIGTGVGSISGAKRYNIDGNQDTFLISQQELKTLSLVVE
jgi:hypothetical protein